jgi:hypothetical protein
MAKKYYKDYRDDIKKAVDTGRVTKVQGEWVGQIVETLKDSKK